MHYISLMLAKYALPTTQNFDNSDLLCIRHSSSRSEASRDFQEKSSSWIHDRDIALRGASIIVKEAHHKVQLEGELLIVKDKICVTSEDYGNEASTIVASLKACIEQKDLQRGRLLHNDIVEKGLLEKHPFLGNTLVTMYAKCGALEKSQELFDDLSIHTVVSWNALIAAYAQYAHIEKALHCFKRMQSEGFSPNMVTFICILKACGSAAALDKGQEIHAQITGERVLMGDIHVGTALVDMYAKSGSLANAQEVFDELSTRNVVTWTALIGGYVKHGYNEKALSCFDQMESFGLSPNAVTYVCILKACGSLGAGYKGQEVHAEIVRDEVTEEDLVVGTALVDMYADCGMLAEAQEVFDSLGVRDVVAWNALMGGYAQLGKEEYVFKLFDKMTQEGKMPSFVTFTILLNVCSHIGVLDMSQSYLEILGKGYGILPTLEHFTCMVDLLGRAGLLDKAVVIIENMPFSINSAMWNTLLGACGNWRNLKLGRWVFEQALQLNEMDTTTYICMRNIYAVAGRPQDADKIEALRVQKRV